MSALSPNADAHSLTEKLLVNIDATLAALSLASTVTIAAGSAVIGSLAASELHIGEVGMSDVDVPDAFTRPADTTAYTIADVIAATVSNTGTTALRSLALGRSGTKGFSLRFLQVSFQKTDFLPTIRVHFYNVAAPTTPLVGDNVTFLHSYGNLAQYLGYVDLPAHALAHATDDYTSAYKDNLDVTLHPIGGLVYYRLEIIGGTSITPSSAMPVNVRARAVQL